MSLYLFTLAIRLFLAQNKRGYLCLFIIMTQIKIKNRNVLIAAVSGAVFLILDIITKILASGSEHGAIKLLGDFLYIAPHQMNDGIAFGIDLPMWLRIGGSIVFIGLLFQFAVQSILKNPSTLPSLLFGMLIGGALGNLSSRIVQGYVIDFIVLRPIPVFNIADIGITVGILGLFALSLFSSSFKISSEKKLHLKPKIQ